MEPFHLRSVPAGEDCAVLCITGEIDISTVPRLREEMIELIGRGAVHLIADMNGVEFLDSTALGALVGGLKRVRASDGSLHLIVRSDQISRIFRITGLNKIFQIFPTVAQCIAADDTWRQALEADGHDIEQWCRTHGLL